MYLLNASNFELHRFESNEIPDYAILSHRWSGNEVTFGDLREGKGEELTGFAKIKGCCKQAASDGWKYVWIDSCCIDKSSSAELSEAINSMFRWYRDAQVCYAYLVDVQDATEDPNLLGSFFRQSKWFTRGWTLQELLAPSTVVFFDSNWDEIGTKSSLYDIIVSITGIQHLVDFEEACVAQKMSWASRRETTRQEDMAYCLMGLFGVNMPPLYGEGENAFRRLQLEIMNRIDDESLFAWKEDRSGVWPWMLERSGLSGLLARSPTAFRDSGDVQRVKIGNERLPFSMTNRGVRIELKLLQLKDIHFPRGAGPHPKDVVDAFVAPLNCRRQGSKAKCLAIYIKKVDENTFQRGIRDLIEWEWDAQRTTTQLVHVKQNEDKHGTLDILNQKEFFFQIDCQSLLDAGFTISERHIKEHVSFSGQDLWEPYPRGLKVTLRYSIFHTLAAVKFENQEQCRFVVVFEIGSLEQAGVRVFEGFEDRPLDEVLAASMDDRFTIIYLDRVKRRISNGKLLVVRLKKKLENGKHLQLIDLKLNE